MSSSTQQHDSDIPVQKSSGISHHGGEAQQQPQQNTPFNDDALFAMSDPDFMLYLDGLSLSDIRVLLQKQKEALRTLPEDIKMEDVKIRGGKANHVILEGRIKNLQEEIMRLSAPRGGTSHSNHHSKRENHDRYAGGNKREARRHSSNAMYSPKHNRRQQAPQISDSQRGRLPQSHNKVTSRRYSDTAERRSSRRAVHEQPRRSFKKKEYSPEKASETNSRRKSSPQRYLSDYSTKDLSDMIREDMHEEYMM